MSYQNLTEMFTDIANSIRVLAGITDTSIKIYAEDFADLISHSVPAINGVIDWNTDSDNSQDIVNGISGLPKNTPCVIIVLATNLLDSSQITIHTFNSNYADHSYTKVSGTQLVTSVATYTENNDTVDYTVEITNTNGAEVEVIAIGVK